MAGVNAELGPWLRMTHPADRADLATTEVSPGEVVFHSWLLALGVVPFDRHALAFEQLGDGGFVEESTSWLQRRWRHERRVAARPDGGCSVTDVLVVVPRLPPARPLVAALVRAVFRHRHRRLVRRFGPAVR